MAVLIETNVRAHVDRLCDTDAFRAAPKLCRLLRFLVDKAFESEDAPIGQRLVAEQALGLRSEARSASAVAARMQIGRLRKLLAEHYSGPGRDEPVRIEIPQRNYRLRFRLHDAARRESSPRAADRATLVVVEFSNSGMLPSLAWLPVALTGDLVVAIAPFQSVAVVGPLPEFAQAAAAAGPTGFVLTGDLRADAAGVQVAVRLIDGWDGTLVYASAFSFQLEADSTLPPGGPPDLRRAVDRIADETGAIACRRMQAVAGRAVETLSVHDVLVTCWRFLLTGSADDMHRACQAATAASAKSGDSPTALAAAAWMQLLTHLASDDPRARPPRAAMAGFERALSLSPADPWVLLLLAYAVWIVRDPIGPEAICRRLDGRPASGSFQGLLGSLMVISGLDLDRGEALLAEAFRRAPEPLPLFAHALALSRFRRGDLHGMAEALGRSLVRADLLPVVLRMALACRRGDTGFARRLATVADELVPDSVGLCEVVLRRLLHDEHVDALAATLAPLELGWFA